MNPNDVKLDKHGFPVPPSFDSVGTSPAAEKSVKQGYPRAAKLVLVLVFIVAVAGMASKWDVAGMLQRGVSDLLVQQAVGLYQADDLVGAEAKLSLAVSWHKSSIDALRIRGLVRYELQDFEGCLRDFDMLVELEPKSSDVYMWRSHALSSLGRTDEALRDLDSAVSLRRKEDPNPLNARAYTCALAGRNLDQALVDVNQALELDPGSAAMLDTRGFVYHLLDRQEEALSDLDKALAIAEKEKGHMTNLLAEFRGGEHSRRFARETRRMDESLAVMYHHRGLVHEKLGNLGQAKLDLRRGDELGYNPEAGVQ